MDKIEKIRQEIERRIKLYSVTNEKEQWIVNTYWSVLSFLDTLSEEPDKSLEEAAMEYASDFLADRPDQMIAKASFIAGAEWQKEQMMDEWLKDRDGNFWDGVEEGKKAMREQMLKDAVEGEVVKDISNKLAVTAKDINLDGLKFGQKVRIVVLKAEEEQI